MNPLFFKESLQLNQLERNLLDTYVDAYSKDLSLSNWKPARKLLENKAFMLVQKDFSCANDNEEDLRLRAKKLDKFSLRYFVTAASQNARRQQTYFTLAQIKEMERMSQNDILERAAYGNGKALGNSPRSTLIGNLQDVQNGFTEEVDNFEHHLNHDPAVQKAKRFVSLSRQLRSHLNSTGVLSSPTSNNGEPDWFEQQTQMVAEARGAIENINRILVNPSNTPSIKQLDELQRDLSKSAAVFKEIVTTLRTPVRGSVFGF